MRGDRPSHPELLDWLAARFVESGWSVKALHRLILTSATYQQAAESPRLADRGLTATIDPDNRLLSRMPRRRLDAESIRDAMLAVSGQLDRTIGGNNSGEFLFREGEVIDKNRDFFRPNQVKPDHPYYTSCKRRSIYLPVVRNALPDVLTLFDAADPNSVTAARNDTTVPPQALFLMNHPFVREQAKEFAQALFAENKLNDAARLREAYRRALSRPPSDDEVSRALSFLTEYQSRARSLGRSEADARTSAWQDVCQMLLCCNEFLYI
jgi:hypothetical protein